MYKIKKYSYEKAKKLGVEIKPSTRKVKKIDVYRNNVYLCSIGDNRYLDYPSFLELEKKYLIAPGTAEKRKKLYYLRHPENKENTPGYFAKYILW